MTQMTFIQFFGYWIVCRILWALMMMLLQSTLLSLLPAVPEKDKKVPPPGPPATS